jgi:hypothetical protein
MSGCNDDEERVATQRTKVAQPIPLITYDDRVALDCHFQGDILEEATGPSWWMM